MNSGCCQFLLLEKCGRLPEQWRHDLGMCSILSYGEVCNVATSVFGWSSINLNSLHRPCPFSHWQKRPCRRNHGRYRMLVFKKFSNFLIELAQAVLNSLEATLLIQFCVHCYAFASRYWVEGDKLVLIALSWHNWVHIHVILLTMSVSCSWVQELDASKGITRKTF